MGAAKEEALHEKPVAVEQIRWVFGDNQRWVYTIKVNLVKVGQTLTNFDQDAVYTIKVVRSFELQFQDFGGKFSIHTHISRIMDPINEQCFVFVICILCYRIIRRLWTRDWLCRRPQSSAYATLLQELNRNEYKNILP